MTDYEILKLIKDIKPENITQRRALKNAELSFLRAVSKVVEVDEELEEYLTVYEKSELIGVSTGDVYKEYLEFCENEELTPVTHKKFTQAIKYTFDLNVRVMKIDSKSVRVFKNQAVILYQNNV